MPPQNGVGLFRMRTVFQTVQISQKTTKGGRQVVGTATVCAYEIYPFAVEVRAMLLVADVCSDQLRAASLAAFAAYRPADGDPNIYLAKTLAEYPAANPDWFKVTPYSRLTKGNRTRDESALLALRAVYAGRAGGYVAIGPGRTEEISPNGNYLKGRDFELLLISEAGQWGLIKPPINPAYTTTPDGRAAEERVQEIADREAQAVDCNAGSLTTHKYKLAGVRLEPDSRMISKLHFVRVGCFDVGVPYPVFQFRDKEHVLYGYVSYPDNIGDYMENVIEDCFWKATATAGLLMLALSDVSAAVATFRAVFVQLLEERINQTVDCTIPGFVLEDQPNGDWH